MRPSVSHGRYVSGPSVLFVSKSLRQSVCQSVSQSASQSASQMVSRSVDLSSFVLFYLVVC